MVRSQLGSPKNPLNLKQLRKPPSGGFWFLPLCSHLVRILYRCIPYKSLQNVRRFKPRRGRGSRSAFPLWWYRNARETSRREGVTVASSSTSAQERRAPPVLRKFGILRSPRFLSLACTRSVQNPTASFTVRRLISAIGRSPKYRVEVVLNDVSAIPLRTWFQPLFDVLFFPPLSGLAERDLLRGIHVLRFPERTRRKGGLYFLLRFIGDFPGSNVPEIPLTRFAYLDVPAFPA